MKAEESRISAFSVRFSAFSTDARLPSFDTGHSQRDEPPSEGGAQMKISLEEVDRIRQSMTLDSDLPIGTVVEEVMTRSEEVQSVKDKLAQLPEVREDIVAALKARVDSGTYNVSSEEIADLMVRRAFADSIR
jgi:flagellar biosynthesis anti-sigma factor FlgM